MHLHIRKVSAVYFTVRVCIGSCKGFARKSLYTQNMHLHIRKVSAVYNSVAVCISGYGFYGRRAAADRQRAVGRRFDENFVIIYVAGL